MADAMGFVDGEGVDAGLLQHAVKVGRHKTFGRHEQQARVALAQIDLGGEAVAVGKGTVDLGGGDAVAAQGVHLIFHQGDERRDNDGDAAAQDGGRLIAERLATAGGHDHERIAAVEDGLHGLFLERAEGGEAPMFGDDPPQIGESVFGRQRTMLHTWTPVHVLHYDVAGPGVNRGRREGRSEFSLPIFQQQARHSTEFLCVVRHQRQAVRKGDGGD